MATSISRDELKAKLIDTNIALVDAQGPGLFEIAHIPGAIRATAEDPMSVLNAIGNDLDREIVAYCTDLECVGSALAVERLEAVGYRNVRRYAEGRVDWAAAGLPIQRLPIQPA